MTLHLSPAEWEQIATFGSGVLFREGGIAVSSLDDKGTWQDIPPVKFVEAAQPCETCGPFGGGTVEVHTGEYIKGAPVYTFADCPNPDCLDGKRRVAVVVPCYYRDEHHLMGDCVQCSSTGFVTVGHVIVTSGPDLQDDGTYRLKVRVVQ